MDGLFRRRNLPHWDVPGHAVFITGCLQGSLSAAGLKQIECYRDELSRRPKPNQKNADQWEHQKQKLLFAKVDSLLDGSCPVEHLRDERLSQIVQDAFLKFANIRYNLLAFVVMPSHHHWLFVTDEQWAEDTLVNSRNANKPDRTPREIISHSVQSYTGTKCNRMLGRTGRFWQQETFDHWSRDDEEMFRIIEYIENNPVKAGLVKSAEQWRFSSAHLRAQQGIPQGEALVA